jgi:hypothetical protein
VSGRTRRVEHRPDVGRTPLFYLVFNNCGLLLQQLPTARAQCFIRLQARLPIVAQAARIVIKNVLQVRDFGANLEHLVDLLLILDDGEMNLGVIEHKLHLGSGSILIHWHRYATETLHRSHREIQPRTVLADDCQMLTTPKADLKQPGRDFAYLLPHLFPRPALPDPQVLFADGDRTRSRPRVVSEQTRKSISARRRVHRLSP